MTCGNSSTDVETPVSGFAELTPRDLFSQPGHSTRCRSGWAATCGGRSSIRAATARSTSRTRRATWSIYFEDPADNVVAAWDFFARHDVDVVA
jgi:hypothetical protein